MGLMDYVHQAVDFCLSCLKLVQTRQVGWQTVDRKTGHYVREKQPLFKKLKLLLLFNPLTEWIDTTHLMRLWLHEKSVKEGKKEGTPKSAKQIASFVDFYGINMNDFNPSDIHAYQTFEDFFDRQHRAGSRPIEKPDDPTVAVSVADSRVVVYPTVSQTRALWIKGKNFTIGNLVADNHLARAWHDGAVASFRLSPQDYHRFHSPVQGKTKWYKQISGDYYNVDPLALRSWVDILTRNARCCVCIETKEFGDVLFVAIGATDVGTVEINQAVQKAGTHVNKGDEIGKFQFGGSSIIVAFEKDRIEFDEDLLSVSRRLVMMDVEVGMSLGRATNPQRPQQQQELNNVQVPGGLTG